MTDWDRQRHLYYAFPVIVQFMRKAWLLNVKGLTTKHSILYIFEEFFLFSFTFWHSNTLKICNIHIIKPCFVTMVPRFCIETKYRHCSKDYFIFYRYIHLSTIFLTLDTPTYVRMMWLGSWKAIIVQWSFRRMNAKLLFVWNYSISWNDKSCIDSNLRDNQSHKMCHKIKEIFVIEYQIMIVMGFRCATLPRVL